jgi:hypothetical protein
MVIFFITYGLLPSTTSKTNFCEPPLIMATLISAPASMLETAAARLKLVNGFTVIPFAA